MAFATVQEVRDQTTISEVSDLTDKKIDFYIERANAYLRRFTRKDYRGTTDEDLLSDLRRVTVLLVEYIWYLDQPEVKESNLAGLEAENIGSYSYNKNTDKDSTGNPELDQLLSSLITSYGINFFATSGPSRVRPYPYNPHAWVTDFEE